MSTLMEELTAIKAVEDKLTANKVANFAYTDHAYNNPLTEADGVASYDPDAEQNIPNSNASTLQVNSTVLTKGWRAQASSITRMLMNHFLGRCSYNLNKVNDLFSTLLAKLMAYMGVANGLATLDENGHVPSEQVNVTRESLSINNVINTGDSNTPTKDGTDKFTTGGAYREFGDLVRNFDTTKPTYTGDIVKYQGYYYVCKQAVSVGEDFNSSKFTPLYNPLFKRSNFLFYSIEDCTFVGYDGEVPIYKLPYLFGVTMFFINGHYVLQGTDKQQGPVTTQETIDAMLISASSPGAGSVIWVHSQQFHVNGLTVMVAVQTDQVWRRYRDRIAGIGTQYEV